MPLYISLGKNVENDESMFGTITKTTKVQNEKTRSGRSRGRCRGSTRKFLDGSKVKVLCSVIR